MADIPEKANSQGHGGDLHCQILTPVRKVFDQKVESVELTTMGGAIEVFARFEPTIAPMAAGIVKARGEDGHEQRIAVHGGYMDMNSHTLVVLADSAEVAEEIDLQRARSSMARARELISRAGHDDQQGSLNKVDVDRARQSLARAIIRIKTVEGENADLGA